MHTDTFPQARAKMNAALIVRSLGPSTLHIEDGVLVRIGKKSLLSFVRLRASAGEEDVDDCESGSDRESFLGVGDRTSASLC
mmetsp:Transcript_6099/g.6564  ORF Transcript_6099/g.6564 Transcript_6099/m.6564 type:complete len:82 (-) Transcript_6099:193-438(-)